MRAGSPHHSDVFSHLPARLIREMDTAEVAGLLARLVDAGWRPGQLRHRVGAAPSQGSLERDARALVELLTALTESQAPDRRYAQEQLEREQQRAQEQAGSPPPAQPEVREQALARMRSELGARAGQPRRRPEPEPRTRPACSLCDGSSSYFVTADVHLCARCVEVLATGEARLSSTA